MIIAGVQRSFTTFTSWIFSRDCTISLPISEHTHKTSHYPLWNKVKFIDRHPHWYTRRVKEVIHIRLHPDNINRNSRIEIPKAWMPTIKKHNGKTVQQRTTEETTSRQNSEDRNALITAHQRDINGTA